MSIRHTCFQTVDAKLREENTCLVHNLMANDQIFIETMPVEKRQGFRAKRVIASHCPFCGKDLTK